MERLSDSDVAALLDFVSAAERFTDVPSFRRGVLVSLCRLVECDVAALFEGDPVNGRLSLTVEPPELQPLADIEALTRHLFQHPMLRHLFRTGSGYTTKLSDFLSIDELHRLELYQEFFKPVPIEYQMGFSVPLWGATPIGFSVNRADRDFSERDRLVLDLVRPHLIRAFRCAESHSPRRAVLDVLGEVVAEADPAVVLLSSDGSIRLATGPAEEWLRDYLGAPSARCGGHLPHALEPWLRDVRAHGNGAAPLSTPGRDLEIERPYGRLLLRFLPGSEAPDEHDAVLLQERRLAPGPARLRTLGLSERETEVLALVASGQTNAQVGFSLAISERTVDKHLEHVYRKLDVSGRTAAAATAFAAVGGWAPA